MNYFKYIRGWNVTAEPYASYVRTHLTAEFLNLGDGGRLEIEDSLLYALAKSTGLKSKKSRLIKKRAKQVIHQALVLGCYKEDGSVKYSVLL